MTGSTAITERLATAAPARPSAASPALQTLRVKLAAGATDVDIFWPEDAAPAPLVIVAHGFARRRHNMAGWGQHLAQEGFVAAVPDRRHGPTTPATAVSSPTCAPISAPASPGASASTPRGWG